MSKIAVLGRPRPRQWPNSRPVNRLFISSWMRKIITGYPNIEQTEWKSHHECENTCKLYYKTLDFSLVLHLKLSFINFNASWYFSVFRFLSDIFCFDEISVFNYPFSLIPIVFQPNFMRKTEKYRFSGFYRISFFQY